jgi:hypothetical protein
MCHCDFLPREAVEPEASRDSTRTAFALKHAFLCVCIMQKAVFNIYEYYLDSCGQEQEKKTRQRWMMGLN